MISSSFVVFVVRMALLYLLFFCSVVWANKRDFPSPYSCVECVQARVGPPEVLYGPVSEPLDNPFISILDQESLLGYSSNGDVEIIAKGNLENIIPPSQAPIVMTRDGAVVDGSVVRGWYHAENWCNYSNGGQTHKSIAYAESHDGGLTFQKINYPDNLIITGVNQSVYGETTGNGDHSIVVGSDGYYYCYFIDWDAQHYAVARSLISSGGVPGTWFKYYNGGWTEPGVGGKTTKVPNISNTIVKYDDNSLLAGMGGFGAGIGLVFGCDPLNFTSLSVPLVFSEAAVWIPRNAQSRELIAYQTFVPYSGNGTLGNQFWTYYTYLLPGTGFDQRYLLRRLVTLTVSESPIPPNTPQSATALVRYVSTVEYWTTTAFAPSNYSFDATLGYMFPQNLDNTIPLWDCSWDDHMIGASTTECGNSGTINLRLLGWVYSSEPTNSMLQYNQIFRCFSSAINKHYISNNQNCDFLPGYKMEFPLGWIAAE